MTATATIPAHVPADRIVDFDIFFPAGAERDYHAAWAALAAPDRPSLVWTAHHGGHWIATRGTEIWSLWGDARHLSSEVLGVVPGLAEAMRFIPLQQDPPEHGPFRAAVMRGFGSKFMVAMEPQVVANARELIAEVRPDGGCEFVEQIGEVLPINIFLTLIGVPTSDRPMLRELGRQLTRPDGTMTVEALRDAADAYLHPYVEARHADPSGPDLFSRILSVPIGGRPWTFDEARRMCRNLLFGGLDTVAAAMGFAVLHLARNPGDQARLRADPALLPSAVDEFLRRYASVSVTRSVVEEIAIDGVTLKVGDNVYLPSTLHNLDPERIEAPLEVRLDRGLNPVRHATMGNGPHRCVGAGLARMELIAFLREWLDGVPPFRCDPERPPAMRGGNVGSCTSLHLLWER